MKSPQLNPRAHVRPCIIRLHRIATLLRAGGQFTAAALAREWEVSRKTIVRDLDYLRQQLGYEADWDPRLSRYILRRAPAPQL